MELNHHIKALPPALRAMAELGFDAEQCLAGTGLSAPMLSRPAGEVSFKLSQEYQFHRNLLALTRDPAIGLSMGNAYTLESYGLFGYAFLSAPTLRHGLTIANHYGPLTFTLFDIRMLVAGNRSELQFRPLLDIPGDLLAYYADRDVAAAINGARVAVDQNLGLRAVHLVHSGDGHERRYREHFGCPVVFNHSHSALVFDTAALDAPMPLRDAETSQICQQQCQLLLTRLKREAGYIEKVRELIVARPGYFPDIDFVAEKLKLTTRTLRRRLSAENSSYQAILDEVRYGLAREYLTTSRMTLEEIAALLGYSTAGNLSQAFKRWHGVSPRQYRKERTDYVTSP